MKRLLISSVAALPVLLTALALAAMADVTTFFPGPVDSGVPAYARIERAPDAKPLVHHDKDWAAIIFYRDPACVPAGFNLLDFVDIPGVFNCPMTVVGSSTWKNGPPPVDDAPLETVSNGVGKVPIWFVRWDALRAALSDNVLTISELNGLNPLKGTASFFKETLRPTAGPSGATEGAEFGLTLIEARGSLEECVFCTSVRTFELQSFENPQSEKNDIESKTNTTIRFK